MICFYERPAAAGLWRAFCLVPVLAFLPKLKNQLDNKIRIGYY